MSKFYTGQKVVALIDFQHPQLTENIIKGKTYTVSGIGTICGCFSNWVRVGVFFNTESSLACLKCHTPSRGTDAPFEENDFVPLDEIQLEENMIMEMVKTITEPELV